jgi:hypothetical protein
MLRKVISQLELLTCLLNPIPTTFSKTVFNCIPEEVQAIVNHFLVNHFLKTAMVIPLLKKRNLDSSALVNFQPISILTFLSKILEKFVYEQQNYFSANCI